MPPPPTAAGPLNRTLLTMDRYDDYNFKYPYYMLADHLFGMVVSTSDCHPRGPGFDSWLHPRNFSRSIGSGTGSTQPRDANWVPA